MFTKICLRRLVPKVVACSGSLSVILVFIQRLNVYRGLQNFIFIVDTKQVVSFEKWWIDTTLELSSLKTSLGAEELYYRCLGLSWHAGC
ncbi:hypothetical protein C0J52_04861 [Blattella germanica]|nr:hypothetical protein C0J52_04861 [Blattella germanica]